jgi:hypothetical protein
MNHLLLLFALFFGLSAEAQTLRFEADTVYSYSNGAKLYYARISRSSTLTAPVVVYPLAQLTPSQRQKIINLLARQPELAGYVKLWSDDPAADNQVPLRTSRAPSQRNQDQGDMRVATSAKELATAGSSLILAAIIAPLGSIVAANMTLQGNYEDARTVAVMSGIASLVFSIRAGVSLKRAGKQLEASAHTD